MLHALKYRVNEIKKGDSVNINPQEE